MHSWPVESCFCCSKYGLKPHLEHLLAGGVISRLLLQHGFVVFVPTVRVFRRYVAANLANFCVSKGWISQSTEVEAVREVAHNRP